MFRFFYEKNLPQAPLFLLFTKRIIKPDEIKSIIVNDTEYPTDGETPVKTEIDGKLKPFTVKPYIKDHLWLPLREFCEKLARI